MQPHSDWKTLRACLLWLHFWSVQLNFLTRWVSVLRMNCFLLLSLLLYLGREFIWQSGSRALLLWEIVRICATANTKRTCRRLCASKRLCVSFYSFFAFSPCPPPPLPSTSFPAPALPSWWWWWVHTSGNILKSIELYIWINWLARELCLKKTCNIFVKSISWIISMIFSKVYLDEFEFNLKWVTFLWYKVVPGDG